MTKFAFHQHVVGSKGALDRQRAEQSAREIAMLLENSGPTLGVALYVGGYDDTDAELFDIPEACQFLVWVGDQLASRNVDFDRLMPESRTLLHGCRERLRGRRVILRGQTRTEFWQDFHTWEQYLRQKVN